MMLREIGLFLLVMFGLPGPATATKPAPFYCSGQAVQGGLLICQAPPLSTLTLTSAEGGSSRSIPVSKNGRATIGLKRDEAAELIIESVEFALPPQYILVEERDDPFRTIEGLDCDKVDARTDAQKAHASRSWVKKQDAFATFHDGPGATTGFIRPAKGPTSSPFGPVRKYIGVGVDGEPCDKTSIHRGYDIAIPIGTDIIAPAAGTVILAEPDLYYEGGTVFLDHGDGLVSVFMHMSDVPVEPGTYVERGERLGASGNTGRTSGPHLHWAVKWRDIAADNRGGDFYIDPALLLELDVGSE